MPMMDYGDREWQKSMREEAARKAKKAAPKGAAVVQAELDKIKKRKEKEISDLLNILKSLSKRYRNKTPKDINAGRLKSVAKDIVPMFIRMGAIVRALILRDIKGEKALGRYATKKNKTLLEKIKSKDQKILAELDSVQSYWTGVFNKGRLPYLFRRMYSNRPIYWPFKHIEKEEMDLLKKVESLR